MKTYSTRALIIMPFRIVLLLTTLLFSFDGLKCKDKDLIQCIDKYLERKKCKQSNKIVKPKDNATRLIRYYYERDSIDYMRKYFSESGPLENTRFTIHLKNSNSTGNAKYFVVPDKIDYYQRGKRLSACQSWEYCTNRPINVHCSDIQRENVVLLSDKDHRMILKTVNTAYFGGIDIQNQLNTVESRYTDAEYDSKLAELRNRLKNLITIRLGYRGDVESIYSHPKINFYENVQDTIVVLVENTTESPQRQVIFTKDSLYFSF